MMNRNFQYSNIYFVKSKIIASEKLKNKTAFLLKIKDNWSIYHILTFNTYLDSLTHNRNIYQVNSLCSSDSGNGHLCLLAD